MTFVQISDEEFLSKFPLPPIVAEVVRQSIRAQDEFECKVVFILWFNTQA